MSHVYLSRLIIFFQRTKIKIIRNAFVHNLFLFLKNLAQNLYSFTFKRKHTVTSFNLNVVLLDVGIGDPQTMFALVVVIITILLFVLRVCFGMFKRFGPHKVSYSSCHKPL